MNKLQIQLLEYSFKVLSDLFDIRNQEDKSFELVYKSKDDLFTASVLKYTGAGKLEFYVPDDNISSYNKKIAPDNSSIFQKVRSAVWEANKGFNGLFSLVDHPELLLDRLTHLVSNVLENNDDTNTYPFTLYNYKSLIHDFELGFVNDENLSFKPVSLIIH